jgi:RimJ/RimL family protein N-acetyltransferase
LIKLESFTEADIDQLIDWIPSAESLAQWTGPAFHYPLDRGQLIRHLANAKRESPTCLIFKAINTQTGQTIGHGELIRINPIHLSATVARILVGPRELRGQGIGADIVRELIRIAFKDLSLHRVTLNVFDFNTAAIRCYQKVGFREEGVRREAFKVGDEYWSLRVMSILEDEYQGQRGKSIRT